MQDKTKLDAAGPVAMDHGEMEQAGKGRDEAGLGGVRRSGARPIGK